MSIFRKPLTRKIRKAHTIGLDGSFIPDPTTTDSIIQASVQPLRAHEVQNLEEGKRNLEWYWLFTTTRLNVVTDKNPDLIEIDGDDYEVHKIEPWQNGQILDHYKCLVTRILES